MREYELMKLHMSNHMRLAENERLAQTAKTKANRLTSRFKRDQPTLETDSISSATTHQPLRSTNTL